MSTNKQRGNAAERAVAKALGGERVGILGGEDVRIEGPWSIEVKSRKAFTACNWMDQAKRNAHGKTPVVIVHVSGKRHSEDLVIMRMENFTDWFGELNRKEDE